VVLLLANRVTLLLQLTMFSLHYESLTKSCEDDCSSLIRYDREPEAHGPF
jgi:hypothetical protein